MTADRLHRLAAWAAKREAWLAPLLLLAVSALAYLPLTGQLGVYRDAWHIIRAGRSMDLSSVIRLFVIDRPLLGWGYAFYYRLLGDHIWYWHLTGFLLRAGSTLSFWWLLRTLWPRARGLVLTAAVFFAVYPGFLQQPDIFSYIHHLTALFAAILSLSLTAWGLRQANLALRIPAALLSIALAAVYLFLFEYMIGFEAVRLLLIWQQTAAGRKGPRSRAARAGLRFLPYLAVACAYLFWRIFLFENKRPATDPAGLVAQYLSDPLGRLAGLAGDFLRGLFDIALGAWVVPPYLLQSQLPLSALAAGAGLGLLAAALVMLCLRSLAGPEETRAPRQAVIFGLAAIALTYLPIVSLGRGLIYGLPLLNSGDRYTLQSSPGAALLLAGLIWLALPRRAGGARALVTGGLIVAAVATHFASAWFFARSWEHTRQYYWQLSWRAPRLEVGSLVTGQLPFTTLLEGYAIGYPADLIYYPDSYEPQIIGEVLNIDTLPEFFAGGSRMQQRRTVPQLVNFANTLAVFIPHEGACLQVADGRRPVLPDNTDAMVRLVAPYSRISDILVDAEPHAPPEELFGPEPAHGWCYYYQRASLAMQRGDFAAAAGLGDQARAEGFSAGDPSEWLPFLEAYFYTGDMEAAGPLIETIRAERALQHQVCELLESNLFVPEMPGRAETAASLYEALCLP